MRGTTQQEGRGEKREKLIREREVFRGGTIFRSGVPEGGNDCPDFGKKKKSRFIWGKTKGKRWTLNEADGRREG